MTKHKKFTLLGICLLIIVIAAAIGLYRINQPKFMSAPVEGDIDVRIGMDGADFTYGDTIRFTSYVTNNSDTAKEYTFNSTCTEANLYIDEQKTRMTQACGMAMTNVVLKPSEAIKHNHTYTIVREFSNDSSGDDLEYEGELRLPPGQHAVHAQWRGVTSKDLMFTVN